MYWDPLLKFWARDWDQMVSKLNTKDLLSPYTNTCGRWARCHCEVTEQPVKKLGLIFHFLSGRLIKIQEEICAFSFTLLENLALKFLRFELSLSPWGK